MDLNIICSLFLDCFIMNLKTKLTISSWNVQGLFYRNNNERVCKLNDSEFTSQIKSDIVCLLETKAEKGDNLTLEGYSLLIHCIRQRHSKGIYGGIALYARVSMAKVISVINTKSTEYLWVKLHKTFFNNSADVYVFLCIIHLNIRHLLRSKPIPCLR